MNQENQVADNYPSESTFRHIPEVDNKRAVSRRNRLKTRKWKASAKVSLRLRSTTSGHLPDRRNGCNRPAAVIHARRKRSSHARLGHRVCGLQRVDPYGGYGGPGSRDLIRLSKRGRADGQHGELLALGQVCRAGLQAPPDVQGRSFLSLTDTEACATCSPRSSALTGYTERPLDAAWRPPDIRWRGARSPFSWPRIRLPSTCSPRLHGAGAALSPASRCLRPGVTAPPARRAGTAPPRCAHAR